MWSSGCPIICLWDIWVSLRQVAKFNWTIAAKSKFKPVLECLALSKISARVIICAVPWKQHWLEQIPSRAICRDLSVYPSFTWSAGTLMVLRAIQRNNSFSMPLSLKTMTDDDVLEDRGHFTRDLWPRLPWQCIQQQALIFVPHFHILFTFLRAPPSVVTPRRC